MENIVETKKKFLDLSQTLIEGQTAYLNIHSSVSEDGWHANVSNDHDDIYSTPWEPSCKEFFRGGNILLPDEQAHREAALHFLSAEQGTVMIEKAACTHIWEGYWVAKYPGAVQELQTLLKDRDRMISAHLNAQLEANTAQVPSFPDLNDLAILDQIAVGHSHEPKRRGMRL